MNKFKNYIIAITSFIVLLAIDQFTKIYYAKALFGGNDIILIRDVLRLHYLENKGAAFGMFQGQRWLFVVLCAIFVIALIYEFTKIPKENWFYKYMTVFMLAGAIGNAIDRLCFGYVRDFIYFELINFPVFNIADCYVTISLALIIIVSLFKKTNENDYIFLNGIFELFEKIFSKKNN